MTNQDIINATQNWLDSFIIAFNICPFARRERQRNSIRYQVSQTPDVEDNLQRLITECQVLDEQPEIETTLLILAAGFADFDDYLDMLAMAEDLLSLQGFEGVYQIASFHPDYRFDSSDWPDDNDPAHFTNRSPYPMLHLIRENSIEQALKHYSAPEDIPARNIQLTREMGLEQLKTLLAACY